MNGNNRQTSTSEHPKKTVLSLILCSRNDHYMGNSRWRLQTTLNYIAKNVNDLGMEEYVEIIVSDWASNVPLREVLNLSPAAARIVSFLIIPPGLACELQKDSPFPEVLALNAAVRRANGQYIGRTDADTLVGRQFLKTFFEMLEGSQGSEAPLDSVFMFAKRRSVPYRFAVRCPSLWVVDRFIRWFGRSLPVEHPRVIFFHAAVGIVLMHRNLWEECGSYDERLIYMNHMEVDMAYRLSLKYKLVDLGELMGLNFYHLDHYHPLTERRTSRKENPWEVRFNKDKMLHPNSEHWGLVQYSLEVLACSPKSGVLRIAKRNQPLLEWPFFIILLLYTGTQIMWDGLNLSFRLALSFLFHFYSVWRRRARVAWVTVYGQPFVSWPRLLMRLWNERKSAQIRQSTT